MKKKSIIAVLSIAIILTAVIGSISFADNSKVTKNETVYVILDSSGNVVDERVVNWIHGAQSYDSYSDFGSYVSVKNLKSEYSPEINNGEVIWKGSVLKDGDIFYEGITDKELPVDISIDYYLDGKKVEADYLTGKSGSLRLVINVKNKLKVNKAIQFKNHKNVSTEKAENFYVPLMVQMSYIADLDMFSDIKAENAGKVIVGESMNLNLMAFPYPDAELVMEMQGKNMKLAPLSFTILPQMPPIPELGSSDDIEKLYDGISKIGDGMGEITDGSDKLINGGKELQKGGKQMMNGVSSLSDALGKLEQNSGKLVSGIDSSIHGLKQLNEGAVSFSSGIGQMKHGVDGLVNASETFGNGMGAVSKGLDKLAAASSQIDSGLENLQKSHSQLTKTAQALVENNPEGSDLYNLGMAILYEDKMIDAVTSGGSQLNSGIKELQTASSSLHNSWKEQFVPGLTQLGSAAANLHNGSNSLASGLEDYSNGQIQLQTGIEAYLDGALKLADGAKSMRDNSGKLFAGFDELVSSQIKINEGIKNINSSAIPEMKNGLGKAIDELNFGLAKKDVMKNLSEGYKSFMDNENNKNSNVQFLLQTQGVKEDMEKDTIKPVPKAKKSLWQRIKDLFR